MHMIYLKLNSIALHFFFRLLSRNHSWVFLLSFSFSFGHNFEASPFGVCMCGYHILLCGQKKKKIKGELWTVCTYEQSEHGCRSWYNVLKFEILLRYLLHFPGFHWQKICNSIAWWSFRNAIEWQQSQKIGILDGRCRGAGCWLCHNNRRHTKQPLPCNCSDCKVSESWLLSYTTNL